MFKYLLSAVLLMSTCIANLSYAKIDQKFRKKQDLYILKNPTYKKNKFVGLGTTVLLGLDSRRSNLSYLNVIIGKAIYGRLEIASEYSYGGVESWRTGFEHRASVGLDFNFRKNNGINEFIPGVGINTGFGFNAVSAHPIAIEINLFARQFLYKILGQDVFIHIKSGIGLQDLSANVSDTYFILGAGFRGYF